MTSIYSSVASSTAITVESKMRTGKNSKHGAHLWSVRDIWIQGLLVKINL
jgi:hypothetical protein